MHGAVTPRAWAHHSRRVFFVEPRRAPRGRCAPSEVRKSEVWRMDRRGERARVPMFFALFTKRDRKVASAAESSASRVGSSSLLASGVVQIARVDAFAVRGDSEGEQERGGGGGGGGGGGRTADALERRAMHRARFKAERRRRRRPRLAVRLPSSSTSAAICGHYDGATAPFHSRFSLENCWKWLSSLFGARCVNFKC